MMRRGTLSLASGLRRYLCQSVEQQPVRYEHLAGGASVLTLNVERTRNALSRRVIEEISSIVKQIARGDGTRVLVVQSELENVFCSGADLRERAKLTPSEQFEVVQKLQATFQELASAPVPTIAVVEGWALGGGAELAIACDFRVATGSANFGFPETRLAIIPGAGGTQRLPRLVGISRAKELIFSGKPISAREAHNIGLVDHLADEGRAAHKALEMASDMLKCGPLALKLAKQAIDEGISEPLPDALKVEHHYYQQTLDTKDRAEGIRAFNEKRDPVFTGK